MKVLTAQKSVTLLRILYPIWAIFGMFSILYVPSTLFVDGDARTTAQNIMENELLFRAGIAGSLITQLLFIMAALLLYVVFKHVQKQLAGLMVVFALVSVPIAMLNELNKVGAYLLLNSPEYLNLFLELNAQGIHIASIFWGLWLFPLGLLIYHSGFFPKFVGVAVIIGGFGYTLGV